MISTASMLGLLERAMHAPGYRRHGWTIHEWDISGRCQRPATRELISRPLGMFRHYDYGKGSEKAYSLILHVRCRMCDACRRQKAALWTGRAMAEVRSGVRSWFGTMTIRPEMQFQLLNRARRRLLVGGTDFDELSPADQFAERMTEVQREVTLWLKRVRKESGAAIRYLLVAEAHKSGEPHLHILVTETDVERPVRYRTLAQQWHLGFTRFSLCENSNAVRYVCKYISKSLTARVRASLRYGLSGSEERSEAESGARSEATGKAKNAPEKASTRECTSSNNVTETSAAACSEAKTPPRSGASLTDHSGGQNEWTKHGRQVRSTQAGFAGQQAGRSRLSETDEPETDEPPF